MATIQQRQGTALVEDGANAPTRFVLEELTSMLWGWRTVLGEGGAQDQRGENIPLLLDRDAYSITNSVTGHVGLSVDNIHQRCEQS